MHPLTADLSQILISADQLADRARTLGREITEFYRSNNIEDITVICITNGSIIFCADLMRNIDIHVQVDCIRVSSYRDEHSPVTFPEIIDHIRLNIPDRNLLLIDDILDTGQTITRIANLLQQQKPLSLRTCVLLNKRGNRKIPFEADFVGFTIPNEFVVGYGLDFAERYRNLPCIGVLKAELQNPPEWI